MNSKIAANKRINRKASIAMLLLMVLLCTEILSPTFSYATKSPDKANKKEQVKEKDADEDNIEDMTPVREVHKVKVKNKKYCFFVERNVVLTPDEIAAMTDEKLVATVIVRSGLYMKKSNCKKESQEVITPADWIKKGGTFWLDRADIKQLREASPKKGVPIKLSMDLKISTEQESKKAAEERKKEAAEAAKVIEIVGKETENKDADSDNKEAESKDIDNENKDVEIKDVDNENKDVEIKDVDNENKDVEIKDVDNENKESENKDIENESKEDEQKKNEDYSTPRVKFYSTYRKTGEPLFFVVVAAAADAKQMPAYCEESKQSEEEEKIAPEPSEPEEILPEYRTISMTDRSGAPVPTVLEDGEPVNLTWEDSKQSSQDSDEKTKLIDSIPGGIASLAGAFAILMAGLIAILKRRSSKE